MTRVICRLPSRPAQRQREEEFLPDFWRVVSSIAQSFLFSQCEKVQRRCLSRQDRVGKEMRLVNVCPQALSDLKEITARVHSRAQPFHGVAILSTF